MVTTQVATGGNEVRRQWNALLELLRDAPDQFREVGGEPLTDIDIAEGYRYLLHMLRYGVDCMVESEPEYPLFVSMADETTKFYGDNNDARYFITQVSGTSEYRVRGNRGDACYLSLQSHHGSDRGNPNQLTTDNLNSTRIDFDADGSFEVAVGGEPRPNNWLRLDPDATVVLLRTYYKDLKRAARARVEIERLAAGDGPGVWSTVKMGERIAALRNLLNVSLRIGPTEVSEWNAYAEPYQFSVDTPAWGTPDNAYARCCFRLDEGDALVIEGATVPCTYMSVQAWNIYTQTLDYRFHRTSLNDAQLKTDARGRYRVVVSEDDPGTDNWIDTAGHRIGCVFVRWLLADGVPATPVAKLTTVSNLRRGIWPE